MFLLPALGATLADSLVIYIHSKYHVLLEPKGIWSIENTLYLTPLSVTRLLLLLPLSYHVHSGTRLRFPMAYSVLHSVSSIIVVAHFFAFSLNFSTSPNFSLPDSVGTGMKGFENVNAERTHSSGTGDEIGVGGMSGNEDDRFGDYGANSSTNTNHTTGIDPNDFLSTYAANQMIRELDVIWVLLTLSLFSIGLHVVIFLHVRSTAPTSDAIKRKFEGGQNNVTAIRNPDGKSNGWVISSGGKSDRGSGRKKLSYWIYDRYKKENHIQKLREMEDQMMVPNRNILSPLRSKRSNSFEIGTGGEFSEADEEEDFGVPEIDRSVNVIGSEDQPFLSSDAEMDMSLDGDSGMRRRRMRFNSSGSGNIVSLLEFHACLSEGYEDFFGEIRSRFQEAKREWTSRLDDFTHRMSQNENAANAANILLHFQSDGTFRALLHLYAHEEVFRNHLLDRAFPQSPESLALSFYAPQLLCFLLHNAYLSTGRLEKWILNRCQSDLYFAHRCYWFLRAWCLQGGIFRSDEFDMDTNKTTPAHSRSGSNQGLGHVEFREGDAIPDRELEKTLDFSKVEGILKAPSEKELEKSNGIKFAPEERQALENLLTKIMESGEQAAREQEFGLEHDYNLEKDCRSPPAEDTPLDRDNAFVPIDAGNQYPSMGHLNAISLPESHGFLPHSSSSLRLNQDGNEVHSYFLRATDFLDSLTAIADDLLLEPESKKRTPELQRRLKELEFSMLPSNSIYVPVNGSFHRVWRIVASESIAISTKERVPCIVYLEVIDHSKEKGDRENERLRKWYKAPRPPQRFNTVLSRVRTFTRERLGKLRHDFEENQEKIFGSKEHGENTLQLDDFHSVDHESDPEAGNVINGFEEPLTFSEEVDSLMSSKDDSASSIGGDPSSDAGVSSSSLLSTSSSPRSLSPSPSDLGQWFSSKDTDDSYCAIVGDRVGYMERRDSSGAYGSTFSTVKEEDLDESGDTKESRRSPLIVFKEDWTAKQNRIRLKSAHANNPNWRLLPILIKSNDDLRQEQLASQLIYCMANILARARVPSWLYPYDIVALSFRGGIIEAIPDTISIDSLRKNHPHFTNLKHFFLEHFGLPGSDSYEDAKANFVESLAGYSIICYLLQIKDRHNGNILLDNKGHLIHIDFGFFFLSSPGKNSGFESAPFKLTRDFMEVMDGANSHAFAKFREICCKTFLELRRNCFQITLLVQMLMEGNEDLDCFRGRPHDAVQGLQERFRLDLSDKACQEYVNTLINDSAENWTTTWYDRYQRCFVGVM